MPLRITFDGISIEAEPEDLDKVIDVIETRREKRSARAQKAAPKSPVVKGGLVPMGAGEAPKARKTEETEEASVKSPTRWDARLVEEFLEAISERTRETVLAAIRLGDGAGAMSLANELGMPPNGIGSRMRNVVTDAKKIGEDLPVPVAMTGESGSRTLTLDPTFVAACREVAS